MTSHFGRNRFLAIGSIVLTAFGVLGLAPTALATGGCLYCANSPVGVGVVTQTVLANGGTGSNSQPIAPQTTTTKALEEVTSTASATVAGINNWDQSNAEGFNLIS